MVKRALVAMLLAGCIPGRHPVEGSACDLTHPCPDDLTCSHNLCVESGAAGGGSSGGGSTAGGAGGGAAGGAAAGGAGGGAGGGAIPPCMGAALQNGGFEMGPVAVGAYWSTANGTLTVQTATVRSGMYAAQVAAASAATVVLRSQSGSIFPTMDVEYCAEAWVKASTSTGPITFQLARSFTGTELSTVTAESTASPDGGWQRVASRISFPTPYYGLTAQVNAPLAAGGEAFVDDVCIQVCP